MNAVLKPRPADASIADARAGRLTLAQVMERAQAWQTSGQAEDAAELYATWIQHTEVPLKQVACFNWGTLLSSLGREDEAEAAYQLALKLAPEFPPALLNLGHLYERRGDKARALSTWALALARTDPPSPANFDLRLHALNNSARVLEGLKRLPEAQALMERSLRLKPTQMDVIQHYVHVRQKQCIWPLYEPFGDVTLNQQLVGTSALAMMSVTDDPAMQLLAAMRFAHERAPKAAAVPLHTQMPARSGRIKIGYLSGDLHHHAVGLLIAELIELHDRERFEVYAFCWTPESEMPQRKRLRAAFDHIVRLSGVDDSTAAKLIAQSGIDVLVDLQALTSGARPAILGQRPAPVQVSYLGLPGTSALPGVDWIIADRFVMPAAYLPYCTEKPIYLPHTFQVSDRQREVAPKPTRAAHGLPDDAFVYCSFNNTFKFTEELFAAWLRILQAVPNSVLWLLADNDTARENLLRAVDNANVQRERIVFAGRVSPPEYLARFALADVMLDTFPYNAGTTASDALWMGTPIVTLAGRSYISRMAGGLLTAVGLPDLITESLAAYEKLAIDLGRHPARVASYKRYLAEHGRSSPLFDMPQITRDIEAEFERLALAARVPKT
jgi:predicted O-linked N-acetylglucosamine transferase (SPINDLY family)